ncbi:MAG: hypothetical protein ACK5KP_03250 [Paludibacteraceae bacterium]
MKLIILFFCLVPGSILSAQNIQVKSRYEITTTASKVAHYPTINEDGNLLLYSTSSYKGLYLYDFETKSEITVSTLQNSGYDPIFSNDNSKVFFRSTTFENGRRYDALETYDLNTGNQQQMIAPKRDLHSARSFHNGVLIQADDKLYKSTFGRVKSTVPVYISSGNLRIYVYVNGKRMIINPVKGENVNYIWASLSPDNTKILFVAVGKGAFVCDLGGKIISSLGYLNAPVWYNDNWIVGMQDKDNGEFVTSSEILMITLDGKVKTQISTKNHIAMYPTASSKSGRVVYATADGKLVVTELTVN